MTELYCANDGCDSEAEYFVRDTRTPLCLTCKTAYQWGQASGEACLDIIEEFYVGVEMRARVYISPQMLNELNDLEVFDTTHIPLNATCLVSVWDDSDETACIEVKEFGDGCEYWVRQSWLEEIEQPA